MYIIIVGGGKVGYYLTKTLLSVGHEVLLIERDPDKTEQFVEQFGAVVVAGDGAEAAIMAAAGAARADVVIAVTGEDEDNLVICQMAKTKFHVGRTIARVNNPKNEHLFRMLGVDITVSQTDYILNLIEQAIPDQPFIHLVNLIHEDMAIVDAKVVPGSPIAGRRIGDLPVPENCIIAAINRAGELIIPSPNTTVLEGDDLIAIAHRSIEEDLRKLLAKQYQ
jgi:trk system potassium uptake protein TrkA